MKSFSVYIGHEGPLGFDLIAQRGEVEESIGRLERTQEGSQFRSLSQDLFCYHLRDGVEERLPYDSTLPLREGTVIGFGYGRVEAAFSIHAVGQGKVTVKLTYSEGDNHA